MLALVAIPRIWATAARLLPDDRLVDVTSRPDDIKLQFKVLICAGDGLSNHEHTRSVVVSLGKVSSETKGIPLANCTI